MEKRTETTDDASASTIPRPDVPPPNKTQRRRKEFTEMYRVCATYCGAPIIIDEFETKEIAEDFKKLPYTMFYKDELENTDEDVVIYPDEMWVEEALPFTDPPSEKRGEYALYIDDDCLPF